MPHIALPEDMPGITAGFAFRPDTAKPMRELAHILLHTSGNDGFSSRDRELVAAFVSSRNTCYFCQTSHGAAAFCMYNRYVDGLETVQPRNEAMYVEMGKRMAEQGYASR